MSNEHEDPRRFILDMLQKAGEQQRRLVESPALRAMAEQQRRLVESPALRAMAEQQRRIQRVLRTGLIDLFERAADFVDRQWADAETEHPSHPQPILFLVASFSKRTGLPLYKALKVRHDDTALLRVLEPVLTDPSYVAEVQGAIQSAASLEPIPTRHLITAFDWLGQQRYVDAYPPFYNGLEAALKSAARADNIIDTENRFLNKPGKARKIDDLFDELIPDARYRRFLRAWIFGDRGNPFRHGDVTDPAECRRQSLRLAAAVIGWLELFGGWTTSNFRERLESEATQILALSSPKASTAS